MVRLGEGVVDASLENAETLTDRIKTKLALHNRQGDRLYQFGFSTGIARYDPVAPRTVGELIAEADGLMYRQKQSKKERR